MPRPSSDNIGKTKAAHAFSDTRWGVVRIANHSDLETDVDNVAILHLVFLAFQTQSASGLYFGLGAEPLKIRVRDDLRADEPARDIAVNLCRGLQCRRTRRKRPGMRLGLPRGIKSHEPEPTEQRRGQPIPGTRGQSGFAQQLPARGFVEF